MKLRLYILFYIPIVLISALGYMYYGIDLLGFHVAGMKEAGGEHLPLLLEVCRLAGNGVEPLCYMGAMYLLSKYGKQPIFRVHVKWMAICFLFPKTLDHIVTVLKTCTENNALYTAYDKSVVSLIFFVVWVIMLPIKVREERNKEDYGQSNY